MYTLREEMAMETELAGMFHRRVDLCYHDTLHKVIRDRVLAEPRTVYRRQG